jgi:hypothetical protein
MQKRACVAASDLPDFAYTDTDLDGAFDPAEPCTNPTFDWCLTPEPSGTCDKVIDDVAEECNNPDRDPPCTVTVTLQHNFHLFVPFHIDFFGVQLGLPTTLAFERDSTFAMTDIDVAN